VGKSSQFLHGIPITVALISAIIAVSLGSVNPAASICWIQTSPSDCHNKDSDIECVRGDAIDPYFLRWLLQIWILGVVLVAMLVIFRMLYATIRNQELTVAKYSFNPSSGTTSHTDRNRLSIQTNCSQHERSRQTSTRICQYFGAYILTFFFAMISNCMEMFSDNEDSKVFLVFAVLTYLTYPLQGLYNLVVFIYPKFRRIKEANQDISVFCYFYIAIRYYDRPRGRRSSITFTTFNRVQASEIIITENEQSELNADNNGIDALTG